MDSLKELCLDLIAADFQKFHLAFKTSKDETLKRHFEFLQRKYSFKILSELSRNKELKEEYMYYLINEHLKCLNFHWFTGTRYENAMGDILCRVPNVTEITCYECEDEMLENVSKFCPKIVEINAHFSSVTDEGIKYLCKNERGEIPCPELKRLDFDLDEVTDEGLKRIIQDLPSLEEINCSKIPWILYSIHKEELPDLQNVHFYNWVGFFLYDFEKLPYYSDVLKICLTVCPRLKELHCSITDKEQLTFFESTRLEELFIRFSGTKSKINVNNFLKKCGGTFTTLKIQKCIMSLSVLAASCPKLEDFDISDVTFLEEDSEPVFQSLISCYFKTDNSSNKAMSLLLSSPKLEHIGFFCGSLSPDTKTYILRCCENNHLKDIFFEVVEMNFVKDVLLCCSSLINLWLNDSHFNNSEKEELTEFAATLPNKPFVGSLGDKFNYENSSVFCKEGT